MQKSFTIHPYQASDLDQILGLFYDTVHNINIRDYSQEQINTWAPETVDRDRWGRNFANHIAYVAKINHAVVRFGDATKEGSVEHLYTHKDYQGKGIASAILQKLEDDLKILGLTRLVTEASITAKPFFEKRGYAVINQQLKHLRGAIFTNYVMKKLIKASR